MHGKYITIVGSIRIIFSYLGYMLHFYIQVALYSIYSDLKKKIFLEDLWSQSFISFCLFFNFLNTIVYKRIEIFFERDLKTFPSKPLFVGIFGSTITNVYIKIHLDTIFIYL